MVFLVRGRKLEPWFTKGMDAAKPQPALGGGPKGVTLSDRVSEKRSSTCTWVWAGFSNLLLMIMARVMLFLHMVFHHGFLYAVVLSGLQVDKGRSWKAS